MTVREMMYEFQRLIETTDKEFEVKEKIDSVTILRFLNWGYERYLNEKYFSHGSHDNTLGFLIRNSSDLKELIASKDISSLASYSKYPNTALLVPIPNDFYFLLHADAEIDRVFFPEMANREYVPCIYGEQVDINNILTTPYNTPIIESPILIDAEDLNWVLIFDSYTSVYNVFVRYIKKPRTLDPDLDDVNNTQTCELASYLHEEVVRYAVDMFLKDYKFSLTKTQNK